MFEICGGVSFYRNQNIQYLRQKGRFFGEFKIFLKECEKIGSFCFEKEVLDSQMDLDVYVEMFYLKNGLNVKVSKYTKYESEIIEYVDQFIGWDVFDDIEIARLKRFHEK